MEELNYNLGFNCDKHTAVLIDKETGEVHELGKIINAKILEENNDVKISAKGNDWNVECTWVKPLSKRNARKFRYFIERLCKPRKRKYIPKRELMNFYQQTFFPQGLPMPIDDYLKHTHRQLMNLLANTAYLVKKERESRHIFTPLPQVETPIEQSH